DSGFPCVVSIQGVMAEIARVWPAVGQRKRVRREVHCVRQGRYFMCRTAFDSGFVRGVNPSARIFFVQEAVRPEFFAGQWELNDQHTVLFVGAALPHKGLNVLLQSMTKLPQVRLRIVGVEATRLWVGKCRRLGIAERVEFLGFRTAAEVAGEHRRAQVFVLPSRIENSPNALTEAMVSGMPVVATAVGGVPSLVEHGRTGILVPPEDPVRLAEAILDLLENPDKRAALGRAAQAVARVRHRPDTVAQQTVFAYKEIVEDYRRR
ncbi:MAG: glycosyltransferase family 4 protein, partial [Verrucomicrobiae bacterium]|nr:glycosyltransferase family 4 protein [Verrucomicrobiae bacterium]